jgi:hypothetical protein
VEIPDSAIHGPGHSLREAECITAVIVIDCLVMYTIMGYRFSDAERERSPADYPEPGTRTVTLAGDCGIFPGSLNRVIGLLPYQLDPAEPASRGEYDGPADVRRISSAVCGTAGMVCW